MASTHQQNNRVRSAKGDSTLVNISSRFKSTCTVSDSPKPIPYSKFFATNFPEDYLTSASSEPHTHVITPKGRRRRCTRFFSLPTALYARLEEPWCLTRFYRSPSAVYAQLEELWCPADAYRFSTSQVQNSSFC